MPNLQFVSPKKVKIFRDSTKTVEKGYSCERFLNDKSIQQLEDIFGEKYDREEILEALVPTQCINYRVERKVQKREVVKISQKTGKKVFPKAKPKQMQDT